MNQILTLLRKDTLLDFRSGSAMISIFLYVATSCFIIYLAFQELSSLEWVVLYWLVVLFSAVNTALRSFSNEGVERQFYYYALTSPYPAIAAKLVYNCLQTLIALLLTGLFLSLFSAFPITEAGLFLLVSILGGIGIAAAFTLVSAIAFRSQNQSTLMTIMSFPVIIPVLLPLIKATRLTLKDVEWEEISNSILLLGGIDLLIISFVVILFPFVWKE